MHNMKTLKRRHIVNTIGLSIIAAIVAILFCSCANGSDSQIGRIKDFFDSQRVPEYSIEELFNSYAGAPYEGIAVYKLVFAQSDYEAFANWNDTPYSTEVIDFLESISDYYTIPNVNAGKWKLINYNEDGYISSSKAFFVIDFETDTAYYISLDF